MEKKNEGVNWGWWLINALYLIAVIIIVVTGAR